MMGMLVFAVGVSLNARGQQVSGQEVQQWPIGKVVLTDGDILYGPLAFYRSQDVVSVQQEDGGIHSFTPVNVQYFVGQDQPSGRTYLFRSLRWDMGRKGSDFKKPTFFEQLNQGPFTLLRRQFARYEEPGHPTNLYSQRGASLPVTFAAMGEPYEFYYILLPDGEIVTLQKVRKDLHKLFGDKSREVKDYVKEHSLDYDRPYKLIAIVNYFNSL